MSSYSVETPSRGDDWNRGLESQGDRKGSAHETGRMERLRERVEALLQKLPPLMSDRSPGDVAKLMHELCVYKAELELQNEELRRVDVRLEDALGRSHNRFSQLYDLAPVAYLTLDREGMVCEANLTAAGLLGLDRQEVVRNKLSRFVAAESQDELNLHLQRVFTTLTKQTCELQVLRPGGARFSGQLESIGAATETGRPAQCLVALSDVTFENLLAELSMRFIHIPAEQVDSEIEKAQRSVCECLELELSALWQWSDRNPRFQKLTHLYRPLGGPPVPERMDAQEYFPWGLQQPTAGNVVAISSVEEMPPEAARDQAAWRHYGIKTKLTIPVSAGGGPPIGVLTFNTMRAERPWPEAIVKRLQLVAQIFANALERKRVEQALRESEERLNLAAESAGVGLWSLNLETKCYWVTQKTRELYGLSSEEVLSYDGFLSFVHPEDRMLVQQNVDGVVQSKTEGHVEYRIVRRDGSTSWMASRGRVHCKASGEPDCLMGVSVDITERKVADERLRESEARFRAIADSAPVLIWMTDPDKFCTFFNRPWLDFTGRTLEEETGNGWTEGVHPDDLQACLKIYVESFDARAPFSMQYRLRRHDGQYRWISDNGVPRYDAQRNFAGYIGSCMDITERKYAEDALHESYLEIQRLKERLQAESDYLKAEIKVTQAHEVIGKSTAVREVLSRVEQVAPTDSSVLISGETGTGKERIAQAIHRLSPRRSLVMVVVNCAALPSTLLESELFGRERGAYTGALTRQIGRFEVADGSTIFLDEIAELSLEMQAKLLRVLQEGQFERLGSPKMIKVNVRVIAATNRDLAGEVHKGHFRKDLYYRLNVFPIRVPPLRERAEDIPLLVWAFLEEFSARMGKKITQVPRKTMEALQHRPWPGNVRELRNVIEHGTIISTGDTLKLPNLEDASPASHPPETLADSERALIVKTLEKTGWRIKGVNGAASSLGLNPSTLYNRMRKLGIPNHREKAKHF